MERRRFIKITAISAMGATVPIRYIGAMGTTEIALKPGTMITSNDDFYVLQKGDQPRVKAVLTGAVFIACNFRLGA